MKVLLTGGTGFIAAHIQALLLDHGHDVVVTVRSQAKADALRNQHQSLCSSGRLGFAIVPDIAADGAFDDAVLSDPPFAAIIHAASPIAYVNTAERVVPEVIDPALKGTTNVLKAAHARASSVKRIIYLSSFAAIVDWRLGNRPGYTYSEKDWNPIELSDALANPSKAYQTSKKLAEKAAWDFMDQQKPSFDLVSMNPPMVFGPMVHLGALDDLNVSNMRIRDLMLGSWREEIEETRVPAFCDVRDVAAAHVAALERPEAGGQRFYLAAATYNNRHIATALRERFPKYAQQLPTADTPGGGPPLQEIFSVDHSRAQGILGLKFRALDESVVDVARSLEPFVDAELQKQS